MPLYRMVKQDYVPTNVDESEFEVGVTAPRRRVAGRRWTRPCRRSRTELRQVPGVKHLLTTVGSRSVVGRQQRRDLRAAGGHFDAQRSASRGCGARRSPGNPSAAWTGNYSQRDVMQEVRDRLSKFRDLIIAVRNLTSLRQGAPVDIDFVIEGPDIKTLAEVSERAAAEGRASCRASSTPTPRCGMDKPELHVEIDRERAAALGVDVQEIAETLRIAVGGDDRVSRYRDLHVDDIYDVELRLVGIDRGSRDAISQLYVRAKPATGHRLRSRGTGRADGRRR